MFMRELLVCFIRVALGVVEARRTSISHPCSRMWCVLHSTVRSKM